jgi:hypothetical protein
MGPRDGRVAGSGECGNEPSGSIKIWGISSPAGDVLAYQEEFCSTALVRWEGKIFAGLFTELWFVLYTNPCPNNNTRRFRMKSFLRICLFTTVCPLL